MRRGTSAHSCGSVGKVADKTIAAVDFDGYAAVLELDGAIVRGTPINACDRGEVVMGRQLGEQCLVPDRGCVLAGVDIRAGDRLGGLVLRHDFVDVDHGTAHLG